MVAAVLVELERHDRHPGGRKGGALLRHSAPQHQPTDPCTTLARGGHSAPRPRARWRPMPAGAMSACAHGGRRPIGKSREVFGCRARCFRPAAGPNGRQAHVRWSSISFSIERLARPERLAEVSPAILPPPDAPVVMVSGVLDRLVPPYVAHDYARAQRGKPGAV